MTPLEEQVEKVARAIAQEQLAQMGEPPVELAEMPNDIRLDLFAQAEAAYYALLPLEVTDGKARITDEMVEAGAKGIYEVHTIEPTWEKATGWHKDTIRALSRGCLSAALTQKGEA